MVMAKLAEHCQSEPGQRLAAELLPIFDEESAGTLLSQTTEAADVLDAQRPPSFRSVRDHDQTLQRAAKGGLLDGKELYQIGDALVELAEIRSLLLASSYVQALRPLVTELPELTALGERLVRSLDTDGEVLDAASPALGKLRQNISKAIAKLNNRIKTYTTGPNREYLSDPIVTQRNGRFVVPVKSEHRGKIRGIVHDSSASGQTVFVEPMDVVELGNSVREAEAEEAAEVARILAELSSRVGVCAQEIRTGLRAGAQLDLIFAKARLGIQQDGAVPELGNPGTFAIQSGRHPLLDPKIAVPLTLELREDQTGILITGPNTGGKTVAMKTVGLFVAMTFCGMMLPVRTAKIGLFGNLWADIGDEQSLQQSLSTFNGHIKNIAEALQGLQPGHLVILDEVGAGTDPAEGAALAKAILLTIQEKQAKVLASTHFGELKVFASNVGGFENCSMEFDLKSLRPTYHLLAGTPGLSHGVKISERVGLPKPVVELAAKMLAGGTDTDISKMVEQLEQAQKRALKAQSEADRLAHRLRTVEREMETKLHQAEEARKKARREAAEAVENEMRTIRLQAHDLFEQLKKSGSAPTERHRELIKSLDSKGRELADDLRPEQEKRPGVIQKGDTVRIAGYTQTGVVLDQPDGNRARIQVGPMKMTVNLDQLEVTQSGQATHEKRAPRKNLGLEKMQTVSLEIDLRGQRVETAELKLSKFIDDALLANLPSIRIVHGKGDGILRSMTHQVLKQMGLRSFRDGEPSEGGHGVTVVALG